MLTSREVEVLDLVAVLQKRISKRYEAIHIETEVVSVEAENSGLKVSLSSGAAGPPTSKLARPASCEVTVARLCD